MKRSKMVEILQDAATELDDTGKVAEHTDGASQVLEALERAGMEPPPYMKKVGVPGNFEYEVLATGWEPEDGKPVGPDIDHKVLLEDLKRRQKG